MKFSKKGESLWHVNQDHSLPSPSQVREARLHSVLLNPRKEGFLSLQLSVGSLSFQKEQEVSISHPASSYL